METLKITKEEFEDGVSYVSYLWNQYSNNQFALTTEQRVGKILDELKLAIDDEPYLRPIALWILAAYATDDKIHSWLSKLYLNYAEEKTIELELDDENLKNALLTLFLKEQPKKNMPQVISRSLMLA